METPVFSFHYSLICRGTKALNSVITKSSSNNHKQNHRVGETHETNRFIQSKETTFLSYQTNKKTPKQSASPIEAYSFVEIKME